MYLRPQPGVPTPLHTRLVEERRTGASTPADATDSSVDTNTTTNTTGTTTNTTTNTGTSTTTTTTTATGGSATSGSGSDGGGGGGGGGSGSTTIYGPPRNDALTREERDKRYWEWAHAEFAKELEKALKEREKRKAENKLSTEDVEKLETLTVTNVDLHVRANALEHHTLFYQCTKGDNPQAVLRRGQEFNVTVTFSRAYQKDKDDLVFIFDADEHNPGVKNLKERFTLDEEGTANYKIYDQWGARLVESHPENCSLKVAVYVPGDSVVGEWDFKVKTKLLDKENEDFVYVHSHPIIVLFNPWSKVDLVHFTDDQDLLKEYVLNTAGTFYCGSGDWPRAFPWTYGQFEDGILPICLSLLRKAFGFRVTPAMADPVLVSRALSRIVNSTDDNGVLVGNWSGDYEGGEAPTFWNSSTAILRKYEETGKPVKFGQCWVFSHVLTAVCRSLGLPCRSVTTFDSAHDTDNTCTIDRFVSLNGEELDDMKNDSIWNFHVWNEVWLLRPELSDQGEYDGWHAIDATPQEQSHGVFQCGPCPVKAIKRGEITVGFDTAFVFSEVNADVVDWVVDDKKEIIKASAVNKERVGSRISTKWPNGKGHNRWKRLDVTDEYKFPEGSEEERLSCKRAVRFTRHGKDLFPENLELDVTFVVGEQPVIGQDIVVTALVENLTSEDKDVTLVMAVRACRYWDHSNGIENLCKENFAKKNIKAGTKEEYKVKVSSAVYLDKLDDQMCFFAYACAQDVKTKMPYSNQRSFSVRLPDLAIECPKEAKSKEAVTVTVSFVNPFPDKDFTSCSWFMNGELQLADDDKNKSIRYGRFVYIEDVPDVKAGQKASLTLRVYGEVEPEEDGRRKTLDITFSTADFSWYIQGVVTLKLRNPPPPPPPEPEEPKEKMAKPDDTKPEPKPAADPKPAGTTQPGSATSGSTGSGGSAARGGGSARTGRT